MTPIEEFLIQLDRAWGRIGSGRLHLQLIGSMALMLQTKYLRGTKDGDVLETRDLNPDVKMKLLEIAGRRTAFAERHQIYLDIVPNAVPMLPGAPEFHVLEGFNGTLVHIQIEALDIVDVLVSKLKPFRASDLDDIKAMVDLGRVDPDRFRDRFLSAIDRFADGSKGGASARLVVARFHRVQREFLGVEETVVDLPSWIDD